MDLKWYIIYRISNVFDSDTYIGCTFNTITQRFNQHVANSKITDTKLARKIRDIGRENMTITDLYSRWIPLNDAREIERGLIKLLEPTLNMISTGGFRDEDGNWDETEYQRDYYLRNKEHKREYRFENKEHFKDYDRKRDSIKIPCDCGGSYVSRRKAQHYRTQRHLSNASVFSASPVPLPL